MASPILRPSKKRSNQIPSIYLKKILSATVLRESTLKSAIKLLDLPKGSKGLDVGCAAGLQCLLLAEDLGPAGHVTGLDVSLEFLKYGEGLVENRGFAERISFVEGTAASIPFDDDTFDWVWSADCVGYGPWEPRPLLEELKRVTKPGGKVALLAWSSESLLPGYPVLEARLDATTSGIAPFSKDMKSSRHFLRALGWLRELGLEEPKVKTLAGSAHAPLGDDLYKALEEMLEMRWSGVIEELSESDYCEYERLCKPESPDFILNHPDYYAFFTYSMFYGIVK